VTKRYAHNGFFATPEEIVHFYNKRDLPTEMWPAAEVAGTVNFDEPGNLGLSPNDEAALAPFMNPLTDRCYTVE
jgi:cytochrome c peroxidase